MSHPEDLKHNIFDAAEKVGEELQHVILIEWRDNTETIYGPYSESQARSKMDSLEASGALENVSGWTIKTLQQ